MKKILLYFNLVFCFGLQAQNRAMDSLRKELATAGTDTNRIKIYLRLGEICDNKDILVYTEPVIRIADNILAAHPDSVLKQFTLNSKANACQLSAIYYGSDYGADRKKAFEKRQEALSLFKRSGNIKGMAEQLRAMKWLYSADGDFSGQMNCLKEGMSYSEARNYKPGIALFSFLYGDFYLTLGDTVTGIDYLEKSLAIRQALDDNRFVPDELINLATVYFHYRQKDKTTRYVSEAFKKMNARQDTGQLCWNLNRLGIMYMEAKDYDKARENYCKGLALNERTTDVYFRAVLLDNIGDICSRQNKPDTALLYHEKALALNKQIKDDFRIIRSLSGMAQAYEKKKDFKKAAKLINEALTIRKDQHFAEVARDMEQLAAHLDSLNGDFKNAYLHFYAYTQLRDKLNNETVKKEAQKIKFQKHYDKEREAAKAAQAVKDAVAAEEKKKNAVVLWAVITGLAGVAIFAAIVFRNLRLTRRQKQIIELQKNEVEEKNKLVEEKQKEILDSIRYARRIQTALITSEHYISKNITRLSKKD